MKFVTLQLPTIITPEIHGKFGCWMNARHLIRSPLVWLDQIYGARSYRL